MEDFLTTSMLLSTDDDETIEILPDTLSEDVQLIINELKSGKSEAKQIYRIGVICIVLTVICTIMLYLGGILSPRSP